MKLEIHAIMAKDETGKYYIVGLSSATLGNMPCVNSDRDMVAKFMVLVHPDVQKTARIVTFREIE